MRRSLLTLACMASVSILAFATTRVLVSPPVKAQAPAPRPLGGPRTTAPKSGAAPDAKTLRAANGGGFYKIKSVSDGKSVHVTGSAHILDRRSGLSYVWSLRILDYTRKTVLTEKMYEDKLLKGPFAARTDLPFDETLALAVALKPGEYVAHVELLELRPGTKPFDLVQRSGRSGYSVASAADSFQVKP